MVWFRSDGTRTCIGVDMQLLKLFALPFCLCTIVNGLCFTARAEVTIDFENFSLDGESDWVGPDWKGPLTADQGVDTVNEAGTTDRVGFFEIDGVQFVNRFNLDWENWSGFAVSNKSDVTTPGFDSETFSVVNDTSAFTGTGAGEGQDNYAIGFGSDHALDVSDRSALEQLAFFDLPDGHRPVSIAITNSTWAALSMKEGDGFAKKFGGASGTDPDFFLLNIYGTDQAGNVLDETVEFYLADYRSETNLLLQDWATVDLSPLGNADRLYFNLTSTDNHPDPEFGMNTPSFFAIDDLVLSAPMFGDVDGDGQISIADINAVCSGAGSTEASLDLDGDGTVSVSDVGLLLGAANRLTGDTDFDGTVGFADFLQLSRNFESSATWSAGDFDCNGTVQFGDFLILSENFGKSAAATASVPEPSAASMAMLATLLVLVIRRRR